MSGSLNITAATVDPALLDLPWQLPLEVWPEETIAALIGWLLADERVGRPGSVG